MRRDSLRHAEVAQDGDVTTAILPRDFFMWDGAGSVWATERLPDGRLHIAISNAALAELVVGVIDDERDGTPGERQHELIVLLCGPERWQEALAAVAFAESEGLR